MADNVHFGDSKPQNQAAPDGTCSYKIYADSIRTINGVLGYELEKEVRSKLTASDGPYLGGVSDEDDDRMLDTVHDQVYFKLLGVQPQRMCMSYIDGAYRECLLSAFDSNKKILYAVLNGVSSDGAFLRLTKRHLTGDNTLASEDDNGFTFVDLEHPDTCPAWSREREGLTMFLEHPYISGVGLEMKQDIMLILSADYRTYIPSGFT